MGKIEHMGGAPALCTLSFQATMSSNSYTSIGSIDERGFIKGLLRKGFNLRNGILELFANDLDAGAQNVHFQINDDVTRWIDDGAGMSVEDARNMAAMHRENHSTTPKRGVSGLGAKPAMILLGGKQPVKVLTCKRDGVHLCITFPWNTIYSEGCYTGKVTIQPMTLQEQITFRSERSTPYGTTIEFPSNDALREAILDNFEPLSDESLSRTPEEHLSVVFGVDSVHVSCSEGSGPRKILSKYNYFGEENLHYYGGKQEIVVEFYQHRVAKDYRFIAINVDGSKMEITKVAKGYGKTPKPIASNLLGYDLLGTFLIVCGLRKDPSMYDESHPKPFTGTDLPGAYNLQHLGSETISREFRMANKIRRNDQIIGTFPTPDVNPGSIRANGDTNFKYCAVQCEVRFNPVSNQDNPQDLVIGVQENKNELNGKAIPLSFTRLAKYYREQKAQAIWASFPAIVRGETQGNSAASTADATATSTESVASAVSTETTTPASEAELSPSPTPPESPMQTILDVFAQGAQLAVQEVAVPEEEVAVQEEAVQQPTEQADPAPRTPVDVQGYRRGGVSGSELIQRFEQYCQKYSITDSTEFITGKHLELYNLLI